MYTAWFRYIISQAPGEVQKRAGVPASLISKARKGLEEGKEYRFSSATKVRLCNCYRRTMYNMLREYGMSRPNANKWKRYDPHKIFHQVKEQREFLKVRAYRAKKSEDLIRRQMQSWHIDNPTDFEVWNESPKLKRIARRLKVNAYELLSPEIMGDKIKTQK